MRASMQTANKQKSKHTFMQLNIQAAEQAGKQTNMEASKQTNHEA